MNGYYSAQEIRNKMGSATDASCGLPDGALDNVSEWIARKYSIYEIDRMTGDEFVELINQQLNPYLMQGKK